MRCEFGAKACKTHLTEVKSEISVPGEAVEEPATARRAGLGAHRPAARDRVVELDEVGGHRADALLVAHINLVGEALAEGDHAVLRLSRAAQRDLVEAEGAREALVERHGGDL